MMQIFRFTTLGLLAAMGFAGLARAQSASIAAVVNGQVITSGDVDGRARLLALSSGMSASEDTLSRLRPQVTRQLIDQTLQLQEINRRKVAVPEADVAAAITHIEQGNNLPVGGLRARMEHDGIPFATLVQQLRIEIGWQTVLHQVLGPGLQPTPGDMNAEKTALKAEVGTTQYRLAEIFIPVTDPADDATARTFATTVIQLLHQGAPFPVVAAQFSQSETALQGGDLGFVQLSQLDPSVAAVITTMPAGAVSNPIRVPGGYYIVQMQGTAQAGTATQTTLGLREAFARYPEPIVNGQVGADQAAVIGKLVAAGHGVHSCDDMSALNATLGNVKPADPGPVNLGDVSPPQFQSLLAGLPIGQVSQPLIAADGVSIVMVCTRNSAAAGLPSDDQISQIIVERRVELESKQLLDNLRHQSIISQD